MNNLFDLTGKVALVTGASSGLGVQFAKALARQGADIAICARRMEKLEAVKAEIEAMGVRCFAYKCDVQDNNQIKEMVAAVEAYYGKIDILVNNAGVGGASAAEATPDEEWNYVVGVNLSSVFFVAREVGNVMLKNGYGKIINIGSLHSEVVMPNTCWPVGAYAASKGGVKMLTKALAVEWAKKGITVNTIGPAYFSSEMTGAILETGAFDGVAATYCPMARAGRPGELDGALIYFASDASS
ncbi:MAG: SDR family NAD(P)-dependent oxidoreductase [Clostridia bacterium]|nr:SDR family NAD(P)-dependent oxidoreductase [Clostridia bacterium]